MKQDRLGRLLAWMFWLFLPGWPRPNDIGEYAGADAVIRKPNGDVWVYRYHDKAP